MFEHWQALIAHTPKCGQCKKTQGSPAQMCKVGGPLWIAMENEKKDFDAMQAKEKL